MYNARWKMMRAERRKKMREKRWRIVEKLEILLEETLAEAEEQKRFWEVGQDLDKIAAAWEASAKDLKWRIPAGTTKFATSRILESERVKDPFGKERVERILKAVTIGDMVMEEQRIEVEELVRQYADVFTLDVGEVLPVDWASHKLNVDPKARLP